MQEAQTNVVQFTDNHHRDVIRRSHDLFNSLPTNIHYTPDIWMTRDLVSAFLAAQEYLDNLYNEFMIRRMMVARLGDDHTELLNIAHKILGTVLEASQVRVSRGNNVGCIPWIVSRSMALRCIRSGG